MSEVTFTITVHIPDDHITGSGDAGWSSLDACEPPRTALDLTSADILSDTAQDLISRLDLRSADLLHQQIRITADQHSQF